MGRMEKGLSYEKKYSEKLFWEKVEEGIKEAGEKVIYTAFLLYYTSKQSESPAWVRTVIFGALGYFIAPFDAIPDATPIVGYTDDLGVLMWALTTCAAYINNEARKAAKTAISNIKNSIVEIINSSQNICTTKQVQHTYNNEKALPQFQRITETECSVWDLLHQSGRGICIFDNHMECIYSNEKAIWIAKHVLANLYSKLAEICRSIFQQADGRLLFNHAGVFECRGVLVYYNWFTFNKDENNYIVVAFGVKTNAGAGEAASVLTVREKEILQAIVQGKTNKEIGRMLLISFETVKTHIRNLLAKTGVNSRDRKSVV